MAAEGEVEALRDDPATYFRRYDALLCSVGPAPAHGHGATELTIGDVTVPQRHVVRATVPFNLTDHPVLSGPFGSSRDGLPIGVQLVGRHFDERKERCWNPSMTRDTGTPSRDEPEAVRPARSGQDRTIPDSLGGVYGKWRFRQRCLHGGG
ncbi:MAG: amidase family protein [Candidatus Rokuibacteriota bacterium]